FFQAEDGIRDDLVTGVQTCALPISELTGIRESVAGLHAVRDSFAARIAALSATLTDIETTVVQAQAADAEVTAKIANPGLPPLADPAPALRQRLNSLSAQGEAADWPRLADELDRLHDD